MMIAGKSRSPKSIRENLMNFKLRFMIFIKIHAPMYKDKKSPE